MTRHRTVVITGGSAGVGRATARAFAAKGYAVAVIARGETRLRQTVEELRQGGARAFHAAADVADATAVAQAAEAIEQELGPIGVWVNNAMSTVFAPALEIRPEEFRRAMEVSFLGNVHGTLTAIRHMRASGGGVVVQVGSALSYRGIPLQSPYCASKHAIRGFTDSIRSELLHDRIPVRITAVYLPAVNTPQFDWALSRMPRRPRPVPPVYQPELPARAIVFAAAHNRREIWIGTPTLKVLAGELLAPWYLDWFLARTGYSGQMTPEPEPVDAPANLFAPASLDVAAHGRFDTEALTTTSQFWSSRQRFALTTAPAVLLGLSLLRLIGGRKRRTAPAIRR
jgi:NAD(P)-dependent dehydrogenase (short-subunit alcohol dehydrogenase family)